MRLFALAGAVSILAVTAAIAAPQSFRSSAGNLTVETVARGLVNPWALAFLPDGRMLVTERPGRLRIVGKDGKLSPALAGVPKVFARGQMGLLDLIIDRDYSRRTRRSIFATAPTTAAIAPRWRAPIWSMAARRRSTT